MRFQILFLTWESILSSWPPTSAESPPFSARPEAEEANTSIMNAEAAAKFGGGGSILKTCTLPAFTTQSHSIKGQSFLHFFPLSPPLSGRNRRGWSVPPAR